MSNEDDIRTYAQQVIRPALDRVRQVLGTGPEVRRIMFSVDHVHIHELLLYLIDMMIKELIWKGILVSVDRPYNYITKLMSQREIRLERLNIVDIITSISTGSYKAPDNVIILRSPFCDDIDEGLMDIFEGQASREHGIDIKTTSFLIFDNIAVLDHYIELIYLKRLFNKLDGYLRSHPHLKTIVLLDIKRQAKVHRAFEGWADKEFQF